jgi:hypothetical protein
VIGVLRPVTPLREGGSLPGVVEADDLGTYVVKFRGAGQGPKALVAEVISGELARRLPLAGRPAQHDPASRPVHMGLAADPSVELDRLVALLVHRIPRRSSPAGTGRAAEAAH